MAQESCNLDKEEAEILKPSSSSSSSSPPSSSPSPPQSPPPPPPLFMNSIQEISAQKPETLEEPEKETKSTAKKLEKLGNRCSSCRRKVGLTGFRCRCGDLFCGQHRYSDTHDCSFDYKVLGREQISKANPLIRAAKIIKI